MRFKTLVFALFLFCCANLVAQQNIRVSYAFFRKGAKDEAGYKTSFDYKLDVSGTECVFYNEETFLSDSLRPIAFDKQGQIKDQSAYDQAARHSSAYPELFHIDFKKRTYDSYYRVLNDAFLGEGAELDMISWILVDSTKSFKGFSCKKAEADYMGRHWDVWYTEEIPAPFGPWLLHGCPGLIVYAIDSDNLFNFFVQDIESDIPFRWPLIARNYSYEKKEHRISVKEEERIKVLANRDMDYLSQLMGGIKVVTVRDRNGNIRQVGRFRNYQPLTSESYWK